ncbi:pirin family protein [Pseudemcibacter aquimaris]|uniref:pirin family protein n=1 Tax=Pseudemcibacter aquimaris TaxID=2857064 RepID=UPI0020131762|nr:pirin family protein [Pseudemcibacter aquimaris]MCC3860961.1 pirin family protein [Pseudemcibacter aquimaris]WDU59779.1 pirin family protein [Pseudemcibacter aquimaris]
MGIEILKRDDLPLGGFAGLTEKRLIVDQKVGGYADTWNGIGSLVYLADANFQPFGETRMHPHKEIDVISVMVEGNIAHEGSLEHGGSLSRNQVQVQRAGGEGFKHNEINPDDVENRMIQLWVLPENAGEPASYKLYTPDEGKLNRVYGGKRGNPDYMDSHTIMEIGLFKNGEEFNVDGEAILYLTRGTMSLKGQGQITDGDLIRGNDLSFEATSDDVQVIVIREE